MQGFAEPGSRRVERRIRRGFDSEQAMGVREPPCSRQGPDDGSPPLPDGASTSVALTFGSPKDGTGTYSGDTLGNTTNSTEADLRPRDSLSSLADIGSALPSDTPVGSRRTRPTGLAIAAASPPICVDEIPSGFLSAEEGASTETVEERAADLDGCEVRSRTTRSKGPSSAHRRSGVCKFFNAQKVCLSVYSRGRGDAHPFLAGFRVCPRRRCGRAR